MPVHTTERFKFRLLAPQEFCRSISTTSLINNDEEELRSVINIRLIDECGEYGANFIILWIYRLSMGCRLTPH